jgi:Xaa-Pro aminopeptidase
LTLGTPVYILAGENRMDQEIIDRLVKRISAHGLDAIIAISPENVTYVTGFVVPSQSLMRWRHAACLVAADGRAAMVVIDMEASTVKAHAGIDDLRIYREFTDDPMATLAEALKDFKLDHGKVAIEMEFLPARDFATLQRSLPAMGWVAADPIFNKARQIKTGREVELLRSLSKLTDRAIGDTLRWAKIGMTELDLAGHLLTALFSGGA